MKKIINIFCILFAFSLQAQHYISLNEALDSAAKNNAKMKITHETESYFESVKKRFPFIENTALESEYGQFNTDYKDFKINLKQNFTNPLQSVIKMKIQNKAAELAKNQSLKSKNEIQQEVARLYTEIRFLNQWQQNLLTQDSLLNQWIEKENLKFKKGENSKVELGMARMQKMKFSQMIQENELKLFESLLLFNQWIKCNDFLEPNPNENIEYATFKNEYAPQNDPYISSAKNQENMAKLEQKLAKSQWMPNFYAGYSNTSFRGFMNIEGAENYFQLRDRFHSFQLGLNFNFLDYNTHRAIKESGYKSKIAQYESDWVVQERTLMYQNLRHQLDSYKKYWHDLEQNYAGETRETEILIQKRFYLGEISYMVFILFQNQLLEAKKNLYEAKRNYESTLLKTFLFHK
jgi:cobalt-zinc-cadmium resistance protein CzcA